MPQLSEQAKLTPPDLLHIPRPILGYLGTADSYPQLDYPLIIFLASRHPDWQFLFIGPPAPLHSDLLLPNIHFIGRRHYENLAPYAAHFDVCIVPHQKGVLIPTPKLLEYLATEKRIITTQPPEDVIGKPNIVVAQSWFAFEEAIEQILRDDRGINKQPNSEVTNLAPIEISERATAQNDHETPIQDSLTKTGIIYLATGDSKYLVMGACSALSLRWAGYNGPIDVLTDITDFDASMFSRLDARVVEVRVPVEGMMTSRWIKTQLHHYSPFEQTLFLDCDIIALRHPNQVWEAMGEAKFGIVRDPGTVENCSHAIWEEKKFTLDICPDEVQHNTGVLCWRRHASTARLFDAWHEEWQAYKHIDQLALARALRRLENTSMEEEARLEPPLCELPLIFNCYDYSTVLEAMGAGVVFWHLWGRADSSFQSVFGSIYTNYCTALGVGT